VADRSAYEIAEQKIDEARLTGVTKLDLSAGWNAEDSKKLTELPESLD